MTALTAAAPNRLDTRRLVVVGIALSGPLAIGLLRGVLPYDTVDSPATIVEKVLASPGAQTGVLWLSYLALLTLPLGVIVAGRVAMHARPVLGTIAATVAWVGFLSLFAIDGVDQLALAAAGADVGVPSVVALSVAMQAVPPGMVGALVFVAGHILGAVLLGIALWRVIPAWAALALIVSQPLHLVFAVVVPNHLLDAVAWALTGVGFAAAAAVASVQSARSTS